MVNRTITVKNSDELQDAIERLAASGGGTLRLEASDEPYELLLTDRFRTQTDAPVRLTSADPDDPAVFGQMTLVGRENITVDNVVFDSSEVRRTKNHRDLDINDSRNITVTDSAFAGDATDTLVGAKGERKGVNAALVRGSEDVVLSGNTVEGYYHGVAIKNSDDVAYTDNEMTRLQGDAIRIAGVQDLLVENNHLHAMLGSAQSVNHSDMIQFFGTNIRQNTERVTIRDNLINTGEGPAYQMIFGGNEDRDENGWLFEDIVIEGNVLYGAHHNMISLGDTRDLVVRDNTVLWNQDAHLVERGGAEGASVNGWIRARNSRGAEIEGNVATNIRGETGPNAQVTYDDPSEASHFAANFVNLEAGGSAELQDLSLLPGSRWDGKRGAPMTWSSHEVDGITAVADVERAEGDRSVITLDAGLSRNEDGRLGGDASYLWSFEDGAVKRGRSVTHDFEAAGEQGYALEVRADGRLDRIERTLQIDDPALLRLAMEGGTVRDVSSYDSGLAVKGKVAKGGFVLDGKSQIEIERGADQIYSLDHFALTLTFEPAQKGASGTLFVLRGAMEGSVRPNGAFEFSIETTEGTARAVTAPGTFSGTQAHEIAVIYDGRTVRIEIDGDPAAEAAVSGLTKPLEHWGLVIGNPWNPSVRGVVSDVALSAEIEDLDPSMAPPAAAGDGDSGDGGSARDDEGVASDGGSSEDAPAGPQPGADGADADGADADGAGSDGAASDGAASDGAAPLVALDFEGGAGDRSGNGARVDWDADAVRFAAGSDGGRAVALGDRTDGVTVARENAELFGREAFAIAFDLRREPGGEGGHVLSRHRALELEMTEDGGLRFELTTDRGTAVAESEGPVIADDGWHAVELAYDAAQGLMRIVVDGAVVAEAAQRGATPEASYWGLTLGRAWGGEADALVDEFRFEGEAALLDEATDEATDGATDGATGEAPPAEGPSDEAVSKGGPEGEALVALDFEGDLAEAQGRAVRVRADGPVAFAEGSEGEGARVGEGAVLLGRGNDFLHGRDALAIGFDLKKDDAGEHGRVLHLPKAFESWVTPEGAFEFLLWTDEGQFRVETEAGAVSDTGWHHVEIGYDDATDRMRLEVDGEVHEARASGTTAEGSLWGLSLGTAWGDPLEAMVDQFRFAEAPDWA